MPHEIPNLISVAEAQETAPVAVVSLTTLEERRAYVVEQATKHGIPVERALHVLENEGGYFPTEDGDMDLICRRTGKPVRARGPWQITECYYPQVPDEVTDDFKKSTDYVFDNGLLKDGTCQSQFSTCR